MNNYSNISNLLDGVTFIFNLYRNYGGSDYIGEKVTQLEHAIQCAVQASLEYPNDNEIIVGAFLHDVGHLLHLKDQSEDFKFKEINYEDKSLDGLGLNNHEEIGARLLLKMGFSEKVASLGRNHVLAKRYLVTKNPEYLDKLSDASKTTFELQGGCLSSEELEEFESNPNKDIFLRMRAWDDMAKDVNFKYDKKRGIGFYESMACKLLLFK